MLILRPEMSFGRPRDSIAIFQRGGFAKAIFSFKVTVKKIQSYFFFAFFFGYPAFGGMSPRDA